VANQLGSIKHIVQLMLENRSFDQMLGFLYDGNRSPTTGQPFEGLTGNESNPDDMGRESRIFRVDRSKPHPYLMPGGDPGEGFQHTNYQLFSTDDPKKNQVPTNKGFVIDFKASIASDLAKGFKDTLTGTDPTEIMGMYSPEMLPIMSNPRKVLRSAITGFRRRRPKPCRIAVLPLLRPRSASYRMPMRSSSPAKASLD
jgi:phospholipase C